MPAILALTGKGSKQRRRSSGGAALSADFRAAHPEFPWAEMIDMRNRIVNGYDDLDPDIAWKVAAEDIEPVIAALERVLAQRPAE
jgi:uncharacterized protein with HEPN domain